MKYFIDHEKKKVHHSQHAGDQCEFSNTAIENREFTTNITYVERLILQENYAKCSYCREVLISLN